MVIYLGVLVTLQAAAKPQSWKLICRLFKYFLVSPLPPFAMFFYALNQSKWLYNDQHCDRGEGGGGNIFLAASVCLSKILRIIFPSMIAVYIP